MKKLHLIKTLYALCNAVKNLIRKFCIEEKKMSEMNTMMREQKKQQNNEYVVINDQNPPFALFDGSFEQCEAFIEGRETAPAKLEDLGCVDHSVLCICHNNKDKTVVTPKEKIGQSLAE